MKKSALTDKQNEEKQHKETNAQRERGGRKGMMSIDNEWRGDWRIEWIEWM